MNKAEEHINSINTKLQGLIKKYTALKREKVALENELEKLKENEKNFLEKINTLEMQTGILKASAGKMSDDEKKNFEKRIKGYIKDIDKCIVMLNN